MVPSSGDLSSLTKPLFCFRARGERPGGLSMSQHAATLGWEPDKHWSRQQLLGSHFAYHSKRLTNGCFGSGVAGQEWTQPQASWELSSRGCAMCGPGWGWRGPSEASAGSFPGCCRKDEHPCALAPRCGSHTARPHAMGYREETGWCLAVHGPCSISLPALGAAGHSVSFPSEISQWLSVSRLSSIP